MAKIREMPAEAIISGFKGVIDYYYHMGVACVRSWPKSPGHSRSQNVQSQWPAFTYIAQAWDGLDPRLRTLYRHQAAGTTLSGRDLFARSYLSGAFSYPIGP